MLKKIGKRLKDQRGLTLVELLAVVVILGIIAAIAVPSVSGIIAKSKFDASRADAIQVLNATKLYLASNDVPESITELTETQLSSYVESLENIETAYKVNITDRVNPTIKVTSKNPNKAKKVDYIDELTLKKLNELKYEGN